MRKEKVASIIRKVDKMADAVYALEQEIRADLTKRFGEGKADSLLGMCFDPDTAELCDWETPATRGATDRDLALCALHQAMGIVRCAIESNFEVAGNKAEEVFKLD